MRRLSDCATWTLPHWWGVTLAMVLVFMPPGLYFGYGFVGSVLRGCLVAPGLTPLGYVVVTYPGAISVACLGTLLLRFCGKPSAWLASISGLLLGALPFLGVLLLVTVMLLAIPLWLGVVLLATMLVPWLVLLLAGRGETAQSATSSEAPPPAPAL